MALEFMDFGRSSPGQAMQVESGTEAESEPPSLGTFVEVEGTPFLMAALTFGDRRRHAKFSGSGGEYSVRNHLFFNLETAEAEWLFPACKQLIVDVEALHEKVLQNGSESPESPTIAFSYQTIDSDTNGDRQLTPDDKMTLAYSRPDGREYTKVIEGVDRILGAGTIERGAKHVVAYEADGHWLTAVVSLRTFQIEKKGALPTR